MDMSIYPDKELQKPFQKFETAFFDIMNCRDFFVKIKVQICLIHKTPQATIYQQCNAIKLQQTLLIQIL